MDDVVISSHGSHLRQSQCVVREKCGRNNISGQRGSVARLLRDCARVFMECISLGVSECTCVCLIQWLRRLTWQVCVSPRHEAKLYVASSSSDLVSDRKDCGKKKERRSKKKGVCVWVCEKGRDGLLMIFTADIKAPSTWWIIICLTAGTWHTHKHSSSLIIVHQHVHAPTCYQLENEVEDEVCVCAYAESMTCITEAEPLCRGMLMFSKETITQQKEINRETEQRTTNG